jgi:transcriptional regulator with XRE-family HTH domain
MLQPPSSVADFVRIARAAHRVTLSEIAKAVRASVSFVSDVEHGRRRLSLPNALRWARGMGLPEESIVQLVLQEELRRHGIDLQVSVTAREPGSPALTRDPKVCRQE